LTSSRTSSRDLHLDLDVVAPRRRRAALEDALRDAIRGGRLGPGTVLPSSRGLAHDLGLGRGTVVEAYSQLLAEGYLVTRPGGSTMVAAATGPVPVARASSRSSAVVSRTRVDLRPGLLDLAGTFPRAAWFRAVRSVLASAPDSAFDYGDPRGRPELREALTAYLARARGVVTTPDRIVICAGFAHGLSLLCETLRAAGVSAVAMEDPCLPAHRAVVRRHGLAVVAMPVDGDGAQVGVLGAGVGAAVVTPAHQYPTGVTLQPRRRTELVAWARATGGVVIEDDYDGEFRYDRQPVGALQGLDPDHVVYVGTASKTIAPGVRLGWLVLPPALVDAVADMQRVGGAVPPALDQLVLAELIRSGQVDRHLRRLRLGYRRRRDMLIAALDQLGPDVTTTGIAAGLHLVARLSEGAATEDDVRAAAEGRGVALAFLGPHYHGGVDHDLRDQGVVVGYARQSAARFPRAVRELTAILRDASSLR
jgi:GntR family transcriptional regulator/MocR family aminotransferase